MSHSLLWAAAMALALSPFALAQASTAGSTPFANPEITISSDGLDLTNAQDRITMNGRIARAAAQICGISVNHLGASVVGKSRQCRDEVIAETWAKLSLP